MNKFLVRLSAVLMAVFLFSCTVYAAEDGEQNISDEAAVTESTELETVTQEETESETAEETTAETETETSSEETSAEETTTEETAEETTTAETAAEEVTESVTEEVEETAEPESAESLPEETGDWGIIYPEAEIGTLTDSSLTSGLVEVYLGYTFPDKSFDIWYASPGFAVNPNTIITSDKILLTSPESERYQYIVNAMSEGYSSIGIDLSDYETVMKGIEFRVYCGGILIPAGAIAQKDGVLVLDVSANLTGVYKFANEKAAFEDTIYAIGALDRIITGKRPIGRTSILEQAVTISSISVDGTIRFGLGSHEYFVGGPLVSETGAVLGIVTKTEDGSGESIPEEQIREILDSISRSYEIGEKRILADYAGLQAAISEGEAIDKASYTTESFQALSTALNEAREIIRQNDRYLEQGIIDQAANKIRKSISALSPVEKKKSRLPLILGIVGAAAAAAALGVFLYKKLRTKQEEEDYELIEDRRNPLRKALDEIREKLTASSEKPQKENRPVLKKSAARKAVKENAVEKNPVESEAGATVVEDDDDESATMLIEESTVRLVRKKTGDEITVDTFPFIVGHSEKSANFVLEEKTISRKHFMIGKNDSGEIFIRDMKSTNGTSLNGIRMEPEKDVKLNKEDVIVIPGEEFQVMEVAS